MPRKPKKPCNYPGCPKLTDGVYCEEHKTIVNRQYEKYGRRYKKNERYGSAWQKVRARYVKLHPFCEECFAQGILTRVEHVHHIKPLDEGGTNDFDNLKSLCQSCHSRIHALRGDYWHKRQIVFPVLSLSNNPQGWSKSLKSELYRNGHPSRV